MKADDTRTSLERLLVLSAGSHGWFESSDAHEAGISPSALTRLRSAGLIRTPRRNVNRLVVFPESWESGAMGALLASGPTAALGRWSALRVHERRTTAPPLDVVLPRHERRQIAAGPERTHARLQEGDVRVVDGFRVTSPAFTVCDLAGVTGLNTLLEVAERFLADDRLYPEELDRMVDRFRAVKGVETLRELRDLVSLEVRGTRSDAERLASRIFRAVPLPAPVANHEVIDAGGRRRFLDFAWLDVKLAVEIDVHPAHGTTIGRHEDGRRQNALVTRGWTVLRFDLADLRDRPDEVAATVLRAYQRLAAPQ